MNQNGGKRIYNISRGWQVSKYIVIGSSNVIFTHSYCMGLNDRELLSGYIDTGKQSIKYPEYLKNIDTVRLYNRFTIGEVSKKRKLIKYIKLLLKRLKLDQNRFVTNLVNNSNFESFNRRNIIDIKNLINKHSETNFIYIWSTTVKKEKKIIDSLYPNAKSVLIVNTYPVRSNNQLNDFSSEYLKDAKYFNSFDKLFVPTVLMRDFLCEKCGISEAKITVKPDYLHPKMYSNDNRSENSIPSINKKIIFLGTTNFSERTIDDISPLIKNLSDSGIEVYLQGDPEKSSALIKYFLPFDYQGIIDGSLSNFIKDFDGVLVAYNNLNNARSNISYPTRYALGLLSNRPIYMKKGVFKAIENDEMVATYESTADLIEKIASQKKSLKYHRLCIHNNFNELIDALVGDF